MFAQDRMAEALEAIDRAMQHAFGIHRRVAEIQREGTHG